MQKILKDLRTEARGSAQCSLCGSVPVCVGLQRVATGGSKSETPNATPVLLINTVSGKPAVRQPVFQHTVQRQTDLERLASDVLSIAGREEE